MTKTENIKREIQTLTLEFKQNYHRFPSDWGRYLPVYKRQQWIEERLIQLRQQRLDLITVVKP